MALKILIFAKADKPTLRIQIKENSLVKNITGMSFKFGVKEKLTDATYKLGPITGTIDDAVNGKVSFTFTVLDSVFSGQYEIAMYDAFLNRTTLTPAGGIAFKVMENIID